MSTDRIEKKVVLRAPRARIWRALADVKEFGDWFGVKLEGQMAAGAHVVGVITVPGYAEGLKMEMWIERVEPERLLSYRWHPYAVDPKRDYSKEPTTLVEFKLTEVAGGTKLVIVESGFDKIPAERRADAFRMNDGGWSKQTERLARHVAA